MAEIKELFYKRIYAELLNFKNDMLTQDKEIIYRSSYKIEFFVNVYEILVDQAEKQSEAVLYRLVYQCTGILDSLYEEWLRMEDNAFSELQEYIHNELFKESEMKEVA